MAGWENLHLHYAYNLASELCLCYKLRLYPRSMLLELNLQNLSLSDWLLKILWLSAISWQFYILSVFCWWLVNVRYLGGSSRFLLIQVPISTTTRRFKKFLCESIMHKSNKFKFKFIYSHLFNYNTTTIRKKRSKNRANSTLNWT